MRKIRPPKPEPTCPTTWTVGPYRDKTGNTIWRNQCPVCGVTGVRSGDRILAHHP
jgi:hypothetical protein